MCTSPLARQTLKTSQQLNHPPPRFLFHFPVKSPTKISWSCARRSTSDSYWSPPGSPQPQNPRTNGWVTTISFPKTGMYDTWAKINNNQNPYSHRKINPWGPCPPPPRNAILLPPPPLGGYLREECRNQTPLFSRVT